MRVDYVLKAYRVAECRLLIVLWSELPRSSRYARVHATYLRAKVILLAPSLAI